MRRREKVAEERNTTRVFLGDSFTQWCTMKADIGLPTDASIAKFGTLFQEIHFTSLTLPGKQSGGCVSDHGSQREKKDDS
uniref:Uncharacterized protein n=1 Tax=Cyprinodon variegatus TaxID=28743 RepID=A0A3Q2E1N5_CYPVA